MKNSPIYFSGKFLCVTLSRFFLGLVEREPLLTRSSSISSQRWTHTMNHFWEEGRYTLDSKASFASTSSWTINHRLTTSYNAVKKNPEGVIDKLREQWEKNSKTYYQQLQAAYDENDPVEVAAKFIYLVSMSFYSIYRVAKDNTWRMSYKTGQQLSLSNLNYKIIHCSAHLQDASICTKDFSFIEPGKNDFVYFDPPYYKLEEKMYTPRPFDEKEQSRLKNFTNELDKNGTKFATSNSDTPFIRNLYKGYDTR